MPMPKMWLARPDIKNNPATWTPPGYGVPAAAPAAVFFIHPTSYLERAHWNAPLDNEEANGARRTVPARPGERVQRGRASLGAAISPGDVRRVPDRAEGSVRRRSISRIATSRAAFDEFLKEIGPDRPIILAGHSQGAFHLTRLLRERVAGKPLAKRIVAAYVIGWPVSKTADLPALGLPECATPDQAGCMLSWQSYAEPADTSMLLDMFDQTERVRPGSRGRARRWCAPTR